MYSYEQAVKYIEEQGLSCDPCSGEEGELICDRLDEMEDEQGYSQPTLDLICREAKEYLKDLESEI